jgi:CBS domain-containing protein
MRLDPITVLAAAPLSKVREVMEENALAILLVVSDAGELTGFWHFFPLSMSSVWLASLLKEIFSLRLRADWALALRGLDLSPK